MSSRVGWFGVLNGHVDDVGDWAPGLADGMREIIQVNEVGLRQLFATSRIQRLTQLTQHGIKLLSGKIDPTYNRLVHSVPVGVTAMALACKCGFTGRDLLISLVSGIVHDIGQSAHSHDGEQALIYASQWCHEEAGKRILLNDSEILAALKVLGLSPEEIVSVVSEEGVLGMIQSIADTTRYVPDDCRAAGAEVPVTLIRRVINSVSGVDSEKGLVVSTIEPLMEVLSLRRWLTINVYRSHTNELIQKGLVCLMFEALRADVLTVEEIKNGVDADINAKLRIFETHSNQRLRSVYRIVFGTDTDEISMWSVEVIESEESVPRNGRDGTLHFNEFRVARQACSKTIRVCCGFEVMTLRCKESFSADSLRVYRYTFRG
jgi:HD superfamily phosphohydrolase